MSIRRVLMVMVGIIQSLMAVLTIIFAGILYFNFFDIQTLLNEAADSIYFNLLALLTFGFLSLMSGLFLVSEWLESR